MEAPTVVCDICGRQKAEVNHWLVAITRPSFEGILIQPVEATETPRNPVFTYEDLCGQQCCHKRISRYLDDLNSLFNSTQETEAL
jgi:hypothetical protein